MAKTILKELKQKHLYLVLSKLHYHHCLTANALKEKTQLSQPSISNLLIQLEKNQFIYKVGNEVSTGGRCPVQYHLYEDRFWVMVVYVRNQEAHFKIYRYESLQDELAFLYMNEDELKEQIKKIGDEYHVQSCVIAVEGLVQDSIYMTDHQNELVVHEWVQSLKSETKMLVVLENDVKAMHWGCYSNSLQDCSYYLHINQIGLGSSYIHHDTILRGSNNLAGEIGLIEYNGKTINQHLRENVSEELFVFIITLILTMVDPSCIYVSSPNVDFVDLKRINGLLSEKFGAFMRINLQVDEDYMTSLFKGCHFLAIDQLLKYYTGGNYE